MLAILHVRSLFLSSKILSQTDTEDNGVLCGTAVIKTREVVEREKDGGREREKQDRKPFHFLGTSKD